VQRTELKRSVANTGSPYDSLETERLKVLRLTATTPDGPLALDLPVAAQPWIKDFEQAIGSQGLRVVQGETRPEHDSSLRPTP